ncbi:hypothetical protein HY480_00305 [Candidatus Uhrbacteria bacterium]|nr:hypothetical protein [Candidatus Uhrbacteria bacterium]
MFLTVHGAVGALIGVSVSSPLTAFALGVLSHGVVDMIPHGDDALFERPTRAERLRLLLTATAIDVLLLGTVLFVVFRPDLRTPPLAVLAGVFGGMLPDMLQGMNDLFPSLRFFGTFKRFHNRIHSGIIRSRGTFRMGMMVQVVLLASVVLLLMR